MLRLAGVGGSVGRGAAQTNALIDEIAIGGRGGIDPDPEKPVESVAHVASAVPAEHELVEVFLDVALPEPCEVPFAHHSKLEKTL
jgi:hypothetical protein